MGSPVAKSSRPAWVLGGRPIGQQLAVLVLVATLPAFVAAIWHLLHQRERDRQVAIEQVRQWADSAANRLLLGLDAHAKTLALIAEQPLVRAMEVGVCDPLIGGFVRLNPEFVTIGTRDMLGNPICTFRPDPPSRSAILQFPWFKPALDANGFRASDGFFAPLAGRWVTVLSTPIRDAAGRQQGLVILPLDLLALNQSVMRDVPEHVLVSVLDREFNIILRSRELPARLAKPAVDERGTLRAAVGAQASGVIEIPDTAGLPRIFAYRRLPQTGWLVGAGLPRAQIFAAADAALRNSVLGSLALLGLALALAWRLARGIVRPLEAMVATSVRIAAGDTQARMLQSDAPPDVAELGDAFNHMLQARQRAESALRENEENLASTLHSIGDAVIATDVTGRVIRMNPAAERLTGWDRHQANGRPLDQVFQISNARGGGRLANPAQRVLETGDVVGLANGTELLSRDGSRYHIADSAAPIRDRDGSIAGVVLVFSDVTAQYVAQRDLREAFNFLRQILDNLPLGFNVVDMQGRYQEWNPAMEALRGRTKEEMLGRTVAETYPREPAVLYGAVMDAIARTYQGEQVLRSDVLLQGSDPPVWTTVRHGPVRNAQGQIVGSLSIVQDVTQRKLAELSLRASQENLAITLQSIGDAVMATDVQGRITRMNPVAEKMTGWSLEEALGLPLTEVFRIVHAITRQVPVDPVWRVLDSGEVVGLANHTALLSRDGSERQISDSAAPIRDADGRLVGVVLVFSDVTEQYRLQRVQVENEARFRALTSLSSDWYWEQDAQFRFVRVKDDESDWTAAASRHFLGHSYIGKQRWEMGETHLTPSQWDAHRGELQAHREFRDLQMKFQRPDGSFRWASVSGMPIFDAQRVFCGYRGIGRDITAQKAAEEQINALAFYDALTGLPNRRLLIEQLKQALVTHTRSRQHAALLFIDLDNFKTLNDTLGHETGDLLLQQVAQRLLSCVREADSVARLGGDEFVVMLQGLSEEALDAAADAEHVGHKILAAFGPAFQLSAREYRSTPSIGITLFGGSSQSVEDLLKQADLAMYQAKAAGRNTLRMFDNGMQAAVDARAALESDLRLAIDQRQFVLHFQPVVGSGGMVNGAEALVRWQHPMRGLIPPGRFISLAESTRLIVPLGLWVLDTACAQLARWGARDLTRHLTLAVNVSAHQFMEPDFVVQVEGALARSGANPAQLKLELTESLLADNIGEVISKMTALRARGVAFSLDDFGTGYSSLSYLKLLPLAHLKIDQSFVRDLLVDPNDAAIARTIVALGASLGLAVIAEGVETEGQHQFLLATGCETFQGYLFAPPVPVAEFEALLHAPLALRR